jgi:hypothetical protein
VTEKRLTVILYGCDRNLWRGGSIGIQVSDLFASGGPRLLYEGDSDESTLELRLELPFDAGQVYGVTFSSPKHRPAWQFIRRRDFVRPVDSVEGDDLILRLMLVPDSPGTTDLAGGFERLRAAASPFASPRTGISEKTFAALDVAAKMACLNIESKLRETVLDGTPLLTFVRGVHHVAVDRAFVFFDPALKARMPPSKDFAGAPGHGAPGNLPDLPAHPDSWKHTKYAEGNVQLSFSKETMRLPGGDAAALVHSADVDIDLGRGLAHAHEWLVNNVFKPGHKTNQSLVYGLLYAQGILPRYVLDPVAGTTARAMPRLRTIAAPSTRARRGRRSVRRPATPRARKTARRARKKKPK